MPLRGRRPPDTHLTLPHVPSQLLCSSGDFPRPTSTSHLDGSLRLENILDLAEQGGIELPSDTPDGLRRAMHLGENCGSLVEYLKAFDVTLRVMQTEEALYRTAYELAEDAAHENVRYMEVRYAPMLHGRLGLKMTQVVEAVLAGLRAAQHKFGIESNVIICGIRNISPETSLEMAELAVAYKNRGVVAFDLAGAEYDHPAKHHRAAFQLVRDNNINVTIHAGEAYGPESIAQAIHICGAHRIGHGCRLRENGDLLHYVNDHRLPLECCPSCNVQTGAVRDLALAPPQALPGPRPARDDQHRQPPGHRHHRVEGALALPHRAMNVRPRRHLKGIILAGFKSSFLPFHVSHRPVEATALRPSRSVRASPRRRTRCRRPRLGRLDCPLGRPGATVLGGHAQHPGRRRRCAHRGRCAVCAAEGRHERRGRGLPRRRSRLARPGVDLVILDLTLPDGSGFSLLDELRRSDKAPRVIVLTSRDEDIDCVASLEAGADDYVIKPFSPRALVARVRAVLRRSASARPRPRRRPRPLRPIRPAPWSWTRRAGT